MEIREANIQKNNAFIANLEASFGVTKQIEKKIIKPRKKRSLSDKNVEKRSSTRLKVKNIEKQGKEEKVEKFKNSYDCEDGDIYACLSFDLDDNIEDEDNDDELLVEDEDVNDEEVNEELSDKDEFIVQEEPILLSDKKKKIKVKNDSVKINYNVKTENEQKISTKTKPNLSNGFNDLGVFEEIDIKLETVTMQMVDVYMSKQTFHSLVQKIHDAKLITTVVLTLRILHDYIFKTNRFHYYKLSLKTMAICVERINTLTLAELVERLKYLTVK
jgi:hypothetical protein